MASARRATVGSAALLLSLVLVAAGCDDEAAAPLPTVVRTPLPTVDGRFLPQVRSLAARGAVHYDRFCTECHGTTGAGDGPLARGLKPPPTDFRDRSYMQRQTPQWYYRAITMGVDGTAMARWDHQLEAADRWDTAFYVWSLVTTDDLLARGRRQYAERCAGCHGPLGAARSDARLDDPRRVGLSRAAAREQLSAAHPELAVEVGDAERQALVEHLFTLLYEPIAHADGCC